MADASRYGRVVREVTDAAGGVWAVIGPDERLGRCVEPMHREYRDLTLGTAEVDCTLPSGECWKCGGIA